MAAAIDEKTTETRVRGDTELRRGDSSPEAVRERCEYYVQFTAEHENEPKPLDPTKVRGW